MYVKLTAVIFAVLFVHVKCTIDFVDCGHTFEIIDVNFGSCTTSPCRINTNVKQTIKISMESINDHVPPFLTVTSVADLSQMGMYWDIPITPSNACTTWTCPIQDIRQKTFEAEVDFNRISLLRPGRLRVRSFAHDPNRPGADPLFCVEINVVPQ